MLRVDERRFTVGVFQDVAWAQKGLAALNQAGFPKDSLSIVAKDSPEAAGLLEGALGIGWRTARTGGHWRSRGARSARPGASGREPAISSKLGSPGTMRRVGFQAHDGRIFDVLTGRGGVLVAIQSEPRAAEALALLHSYGGGNAAIGAWTGRV